MTETKSDARLGTRSEMLWLAIWCVLIFVLTLTLNSRHNGFPCFYHPDESSKAEQVISDRWNFHHPMLLLTTTKIAVRAFGVKLQEQDVVEAGRWVSAGFTAAAVVAFSLLAFAWRGWTAALASGFSLMLHHQLFELSHYMKEDPALLMGVGWTFFATFLLWQRPGPLRAAFLGAATALAISGKYLGLVVLAVALPAVWCAPGDRAGRVKWFGAALVLLLMAVNLPLLLQPGVFEKSFDREMQSVIHGQRGVTRSVPHLQYWNVFRDNSTVVMWLLLLVFLAARWRERRTVPLAEWLLISFPFAFAVMLSFSPKSNDRYFLPATAAFTFLASLGVVDAARLLTRWVPWRWALAGTALALTVAQLPGWLAYEAAFQTDDNAALIESIKASLPPDAVIAKDSRIELPDPNNAKDLRRFPPMPQRILSARFAADFGSIAEQRARGVTHVAVSESDYGRFFLRGLRPQKDEAENFARRKAFYEELLRDGELVFQRERGAVLYLHPGIRLYQIPRDLD